MILTLTPALNRLTIMLANDVSCMNQKATSISWCSLLIKSQIGVRQSSKEESQSLSCACADRPKMTESKSTVPIERTRRARTKVVISGIRPHANMDSQQPAVVARSDRYDQKPLLRDSKRGPHTMRLISSGARSGPCPGCPGVHNGPAYGAERAMRPQLN